MFERAFTVGIVDDDPIVRRALAGTFSRWPGVRPIPLGNGEEAVAHARDGAADAYLIDVSMPVMDGISTVITLRALGVASRIVLLSALHTESIADVARIAGADAFLVKTAPVRDVLNAIIGEDAVVPWSVSAARVQVEAELNDKERAILRLLCEARSNAEIARELHLAESTVKSYVGSILKKMGVESRLQAVVKAYRVGLSQIAP